VKNIVLMLFVLIAAVACNSCAPQPSPVPPAPAPVPTVVVPPPGPWAVVDAGPEPVVDASVRQACQALAGAGCVEGGPSCPVNLQKALDDRLTTVPLACLVGVRTKADVHACGRFVVCQ